MKVDHYIAIEPQDKELYEEAFKKFKITHAKLIICPFSNHGDGPGRARNYVWDIAKANGFEYHWVLDDNIQDFYRLHKNQRIRIETGACFRASEDFIERFENVPVSGFQYRFFIAPRHRYPAYVKNTRIYSTLLIRNDCEHRWRLRYNEDTDLSLRVLKAGDCTIQFNAFLQGKCPTQTVKGGNTEEFYHKEGSTDKEKWRDGYLNSEGTIKKSQLLVDMHPDVCSMVFKYGRWHHYCDYSPWKNNKLIYKKDFDLKALPKVNNYGLKLITNYVEQDGEGFDGEYEESDAEYDSNLE
jgi:hypothetical protein